MTEPTTTLSVGGDSLTTGSDNSQYLSDPFGGDDVVLQSITEQFNEGETSEDGSEQANSTGEDQEDRPESDSPEDVQETEEKEDTALDEEKEESTEPTEKPKVIYKVKIDGKEMDVPDNAIFKIKVDGKTQHVSLSELATDFNGRTVWASKFSELGREKQAMQLERQQMTTKYKTVAQAIQDAGDLLNQKNPLGAILKLSKATGRDSKEDVANFLIQADKSLSEWASMSPANKQLLLDQIELEQHREKTQEVLKEKEMRESSERELDETQQLILDSGFTVQEYLDASKWLVENTPEVFTEDNKENRQIVLDTLARTNQYLEVEGVAKKVNPQKYNSLKPELQRELISKMLKFKAIGEWESVSELEEMLVELLGKPNSQPKTSLASPKAANQNAKPSATKGSSNNKNPSASQVDLESIFKNVLESDI